MPATRGVCQTCGGPLVPIVYGYPDPELFAAADRGDVLLGGCIVMPGQPQVGCPRCAG